jgi:outer membrane protein assembly factor BamB
MHSALLTLILLAAPPRPDLREPLWDAARRGDAKTVGALLARGADVNARTRYGASALWFAAYKGRTEVVKLLLEHKANVDSADGIWGMSPLRLAAGDDKGETVRLLLRAGAKGGEPLFLQGVLLGKLPLLQAVLDGQKVPPATLGAALLTASKDDVKAFLTKVGAKPLPPGSAEQRKAWEALAGTYTSGGGARFVVSVRDGRLLAQSPLGYLYVLEPGERGAFGAIGFTDVRVSFTVADGKGKSVALKAGAIAAAFDRNPAKKEEVVRPGPYRDEPVVVKSASNWPAFRGAGASGVADGQHPPAVWDAAKPHAGMWKTPIPELGLSSPVIWGDRLFITTAVSSDPKSEFKPGLYGGIGEAKDRTGHSWRIYCLDRHSGKILWERQPAAGVPRVRRHTKASHANATPVTDGKVLIVSFGSEGLYGYDLEGKQLWKQELGLLDAGMFSDPDIQWESGSSPILHEGLVIVQCDRQKNSYLAAFRADTGKPVWRTARDEPPSWGTPTIVAGKDRVELVANGTTAVRGYDPATGKELWRLGRNAQITVPTPIAGEGLIFATSGYAPVQPIYAIRPGAQGDITLADRAESSDAIAWSKLRGGPYMTTPICYRGYLYCCGNSGNLSCHEARTGKLVYTGRLGGKGGYTASPVAADGRLYFTGEDGKVQVVQAGPTYRLLAESNLGDACLATPAISGGKIYFRTQKYVLGIGHAPAPRVAKTPPGATGIHP